MPYQSFNPAAGKVLKTFKELTATQFEKSLRHAATCDIAGVGCLVDSCRTCASCKVDLEQFCEAGAIFTYNSPDKHSGGITHGGYSESIVVDESFVLKVPKNLDHAAAAPLLCAGITTYSPLKHYKIAKVQKVGVVGLGGLGHMGVKLAKAFGAHVVAFTTSSNKGDVKYRFVIDMSSLQKARVLS